MLRSLCCAPQPPLNTRPSISARPASVIERRRIPEKEEEWEGFGRLSEIGVGMHTLLPGRNTWNIY